MRWNAPRSASHNRHLLGLSTCSGQPAKSAPWLSSRCSSKRWAWPRRRSTCTKPDCVSAARQAAYGSTLRVCMARSPSRVVVVPGFLGTTLDGGIATLGRGGSDLTAVLLAAGLGAVRCELVKDVAGYFSADPHRDSSACHLPELTFADALALADSGCDLVQRQAIEAAARAHLPIVVRSLNESAPVTLVHGVSQVPVSAKPTNDNYHPVCPERTRREPAFAGEESAFRNQ